MHLQRFGADRDPNYWRSLVFVPNTRYYRCDLRYSAFRDNLEERLRLMTLRSLWRLQDACMKRYPIRVHLLAEYGLLHYAGVLVFLSGNLAELRKHGCARLRYSYQELVNAIYNGDFDHDPYL